MVYSWNKQISGNIEGMNTLQRLVCYVKRWSVMKGVDILMCWTIWHQGTAWTMPRRKPWMLAKKRPALCWDEECWVLQYASIFRFPWDSLITYYCSFVEICWDMSRCCRFDQKGHSLQRWDLLCFRPGWRWLSSSEMRWWNVRCLSVSWKARWIKMATFRHRTLSVAVISWSVAVGVGRRASKPPRWGKLAARARSMTAKQRPKMSHQTIRFNQFHSNFPDFWFNGFGWIWCREKGEPERTRERERESNQASSMRHFWGVQQESYLIRGRPKLWQS